MATFNDDLIDMVIKRGDENAVVAALVSYAVAADQVGEAGRLAQAVRAWMESEVVPLTKARFN